MDNVDEVRDAVVSHRAMFGTVDSWLIWVLQERKKEKPLLVQRFLSSLLCVESHSHAGRCPQCLTGGKSGGVHCTDVTNASRTMLFNIHTLDWDQELCK